MTFRTLTRIGSLALAAFLCLGHGEAKGCGGGEDDGHHGGGTATGATCPPSNAITAQSFGTAFMETYCLSCHSKDATGPARAEAPMGVDFDTLDDVRRQSALIDMHAAAGPKASNTDMPPASRPQPTRQEREQLGQWLACGAP